MRIVGGVMASGSTKNVDIMRVLGDDRLRYSKNVFILSKKPSLSSSIDMPLSLPNS